MIDESSIEEIEELAEYISDMFWADQCLDPEVVIKKNGLGLIYNDYEDAFDGLLHYGKGKFTVFCNTARPGEPRRRFTLSHELGHYFLPRHHQALRYRNLEHASHCNYTSNEKMEREADTFASNLLMPKKRFINAAKRVPRGLEGVKKLASNFGTSLTSTAIRYLDLHLGEGVLIKWTSEGKYAWRRLPSDVGFDFKNITIRSRDQLVPDSATDALFQNKVDPALIHRKGTVKSAWFSNLSARYEMSDIWVEDVMRLGQYGAITLVFPER